MQPGIKVENEKEWRQALTRNMLKSNLWSINENSVSLNKDALFRSFLKLPSNVITGQFEVKILHYRNSQLISQQINSINVSKSGISAEFRYSSKLFHIIWYFCSFFGSFSWLGIQSNFRKV